MKCPVLEMKNDLEEIYKLYIQYARTFFERGPASVLAQGFADIFYQVNQQKKLNSV